MLIEMQMQMQKQMQIWMRLVVECIVSLLRAWSMMRWREMGRHMATEVGHSALMGDEVRNGWGES
jgi:hypothetical protein